jgi:hypothetical protein
MQMPRILPVFIILLFLINSTGWSAPQPARRGFWASLQLGYGSVQRTADQEPRDQQDTFAMSYILGGTVTSYLRLGLELNGWLLEPYDVWDPAKGVGISQTFVIMQVYPGRSSGIFLKAGGGRSTFSDSHPTGFNSSGWGATVGLGYDLPLPKNILLTAVINYSNGGLGSVHNQILNVSHRKYKVFDARLAITIP